MFRAIVFLIFLNGGHAIILAKGNKTSYEMYQLWHADTKGVNLTSEFEKRIAEKDILNSNAIPNIPSEDVWHRCDNNIDFLLNGNETEYWNKFLESQNISYEVLLEDVQRAIEKEDLMKKYGDWRRDGKINWSSHPSLNDINEYLKSVAAADSTYCSLKSIGQTVHKKDIKMLKISNGKPENEAILLEAGLHGQEWVAVLSLLYFIEQIGGNFTNQTDYIKDKDWYIIPVMNPDGYEYSMTKDRLWRKNRKRFSGPCDGVDLNRNFDINWGTRETLMDICSMNYGGPVPFSEKETIALRDLINGRHFTAYVSVHSYGSAVLFPWIYDGRPTKDGATHTRLAAQMVKAMSSVANVQYRAGTSSQLHLRKAPGNSVDWAYSRGIEFTFALETRGGNNAQFMDGNQLLPAAKEVTAGLKRLAEVIYLKH